MDLTITSDPAQPIKNPNHGFTRQEFDLLLNFTKNLIQQAVAGIYSGDPALRPTLTQNLQGTCDYCPYSSICRCDEGALEPRLIERVHKEQFFSEATQ